MLYYGFVVSYYNAWMFNYVVTVSKCSGAYFEILEIVIAVHLYLYNTFTWRWEHFQFSLRNVRIRGKEQNTSTDIISADIQSVQRLTHFLKWSHCDLSH